jgi:glutamate-1-semialdehyde 2,1-aminomutase
MSILETQRSLDATQRLRAALPGGDTRTGTYYAPFPLVLARGEGTRLWDVDGNEYVDCVNNFTSLVHGNAHPAIVEALREQAGRGTAFAAPTELQAEVGEMLRRRVEGVERVRFTNSGSEANVLAIRAARAFTGRDLVVKAHGGYHGMWEQLPPSFPGAGIPEAVGELAIEVDYNDTEALEAAMTARGHEIAALIFEPVMTAGGVIAADREFLATARRLADEAGALLVLDEIVTLRLAHGAWQSQLGVRPDLTTFAKIIGGGLPIGAVGGRADVLAVFDPRRDEHISHSGTFNGNSMSLAAGRVSLELLTPEEIERINALGARLAGGVRGLLPDAVVTSVGSLVQIHLGAVEPIRCARDARTSGPGLAALHHAALREGVFFAPRGLLNTSTAMDEAVVDKVLARLERAVEATSRQA